MRRLAGSLLIMLLVACSSGGDRTDAEPGASPTAIKGNVASEVSPSPTSTVTPVASRVPTENEPPTATESNPDAPSPEAVRYLEAAIEYMKERSIHRDEVDWESLDRRARQMIGDARSPSGTYRAIRFALDQLEDGHSFFLDPIQARAHEHGGDNAPLPHGERLDGGIGYIALPPAMHGGDLPERYAAAAIDAVQRIDQEPVCGWIVDLRGNSGGNMWPMLGGIGPVLGEGVAGAFVYPDDERLDWTYRDGAIALGGETKLEAPTYTPQEPDPPVAVLTDHETGSSGEAVALAFRGRPDTRSFGMPTSGVPTVNEAKTMSDGAVLVVTEALMADRTGQSWSGPIPPDEEVAVTWSPEHPNRDDVLEAGHEWLLQQPDCR